MRSLQILVASLIMFPGVAAPLQTGAEPEIGDFWKAGEIRNYVFRMGNVEIGRQSNKLVQVKDTFYTFEQSLWLDLSGIGKSVKLKQKATLSVNPHGAPLSYSLTGGEISLDISFEEGYADVAIRSAGMEENRKIPCIGKKTFIIDQNFVGDLNLPLCLIDMEKGVKIPFHMFVPQLLKGVSTEIEISGSGVSEDGHIIYLGKMTPPGWSIWVSKDRKLLKAHDAATNLTVELER